MKTRQAFTLIEMIIAILVLSIVISGTAFVMIQGNQNMVTASAVYDAIHLAHLYMEEILACGHWDEQTGKHPLAGQTIPTALASIGPEEANRQAFDDVDDYHQFRQSGNHQGKDKTPFGSKYDAYTVEITVSFVPFGQSQATGTKTNLKKIDVTVTWNHTQSTTLTTVVTNQ
jgi:prepilin-type N-terminal cleavage/methylation domain-containing protein